MAERWDERERSGREEREHRAHEYGERGRTERTADEVRSWFGDDDAARRRRMDELREPRGDRDWSDRTENAAGRTWERARETARDITDRDRDGRRGLSEWNDNDRPIDRSRFSQPVGGIGRGRDDYWTGNRGYGESSSYTVDPYVGSRADTRPAVHGPHAGRGPRGYRRGDERIREDVCDRLTDDPRIDASDIDIQVKEGEVTLAGSVRSRDEKRFTEDLVERISGVRDVNNHLKVRAADEVIGTARSGASVLGLTDAPPPPATKTK
jgi:osmotically-inducible protein OsmY